VEEYTKLEMDFAMKSINLEKHKFTNYVKTNQNKQYKLLEKIYSDYKNGKRLSDILSYNNMDNFTMTRITNTLKFHLKDNNQIRLFIEIEKNNILKVRLIDLFHLAIPSEHKGMSSEVMKDKLYNQHKNNRLSINLIKNKYKEQI